MGIKEYADVTRRRGVFAAQLGLHRLTFSVDNYLDSVPVDEQNAMVQQMGRENLDILQILSDCCVEEVEKADKDFFAKKMGEMRLALRNAEESRHTSQWKAGCKTVIIINLALCKALE